MSETSSNPSADEFAEDMFARIKSMTQGVEQMPYIRGEHLVDLSKIVTVYQTPLASDDLDTAIQMVNRTSYDHCVPIARGRSIELSARMTLHRTSANPIEEFDVMSALRYLARRPAGPQV